MENKNINLKFLKIDKEAVVPKYAHGGDACFDFKVLVKEGFEPFRFIYDKEDKINISNGSVSVFPKETIVFHTGLKCATEKGFMMKIYPRSSTGIKKGLSLANGTGIIDTATYRGEIMLAFTNHSQNVVHVHHLDKMAQGEICVINQVNICEVDSLDSTARGEGGIGSTKND